MPELSEVFPSRFLKAEDLRGKEPTVTIASVDFEVFDDNGRQTRKPVVTFRNARKCMILNKTNSYAIGKIAGSNNTDAWPGTAITLYGTTVQFGSQPRDAIRVRKPTPPPAERPTAGDVSAEAQRPVQQSETDQAVDALADELDDGLDI